MSYSAWRVSYAADEMERMAGANKQRASQCEGEERAYFMGRADAYYDLVPKGTEPNSYNTVALGRGEWEGR